MSYLDCAGHCKQVWRQFGVCTKNWGSVCSTFTGLIPSLLSFCAPLLAVQLDTISIGPFAAAHHYAHRIPHPMTTCSLKCNMFGSFA